MDIKPDNLLLVGARVTLRDSCLSKDLAGMMATLTSGITPIYASPETFDGKVTRYCDQYSLAVTYQELLTGQRPLRGQSLQQLIMQHLSGSPDLSPLPSGDRIAVGRALSKNPGNRYPSCGDFVRALQSAGVAGVCGG